MKMAIGREQEYSDITQCTDTFLWCAAFSYIHMRKHTNAAWHFMSVRALFQRQLKTNERTNGMKSGYHVCRMSTLRIYIRILLPLHLEHANIL